MTGFSAGDEVIGWTDNRASQAEYVLVEAGNLTAKPAGVPWEAAGGLFVAGATAYAAVRAVAAAPATRSWWPVRRAGSAPSRSSWPGGPGRR